VQFLYALRLLGLTDNAGACTFNVTCTTNRLPPSVKVICPVYVPTFPWDIVIVALCAAPALNVPLAGITFNQLVLAAADQLAALPQLITVAVCLWMAPITLETLNVPGVTLMHPACIVKDTISETWELLAWLLKIIAVVYFPGLKFAASVLTFTCPWPGAFIFPEV
jgi:hypothetical protein